MQTNATPILGLAFVAVVAGGIGFAHAAEADPLEREAPRYIAFAQEPQPELPRVVGAPEARRATHGRLEPGSDG